MNQELLFDTLTQALGDDLPSDGIAELASLLYVASGD